jgi:hypothetical protein
VNEPRRLVDESGTPFERSLLGALRDERPSPELQRRMRQGLVVAGATAASKVAVAGWLKVAVAGAVAASLGAGVSVWQHRSSPPQAQAVVTSAPPSQAAPVAPLAQVEPAREQAAPAEVAAVEPVAPITRARPLASAAGDLREEIRLLDEVRSKVRAGAYEQALKLLGKYDRRFPRGQFRQEAQVLRVEALGRSGKQDAALVLGKKFVTEHPESPHVERVESVTGSPR